MRYMVDDVKRGNLRLLLSGRTSSAGRPMPDGRQPAPGGGNRIHLLVDDIETEVARLRAAGVSHLAAGGCLFQRTGVGDVVAHAHAQRPLSVGVALMLSTLRFGYFARMIGA